MATATANVAITDEWTVVSTGKANVMVEAMSADVEVAVAASAPAATVIGHKARPSVSLSNLGGADNVYARVVEPGNTAATATVIVTTGP
jgi:hypothetical protein